MAIPYRGALAYALLGSSTGVGPRLTGIIGDFQSTGTSRPRQLDFDAYQWHLKNYPDQDTAIVPLGFSSSGRVILKQIGADCVYEYPSDIVYEYDPDPPLSQPVPDPNGENGTVSLDVGVIVVYDDVYPRWATDTAYSFAIDNVGVIPQLGLTTTFDESMFNLNAVYGGHVSWEVSADNYDSWVKNVSNNETEYYPFKQTKNNLKITSKFKVIFEGDICCWNKGATISGKVGFNSVSVTTETIPYPPEDEPGAMLGYAGISLKLGDSYDDAGEVDWEVTIDEDFVPPEIEIPNTPGKVTFINDFWITSVVKA